MTPRGANGDRRPCSRTQTGHDRGRDRGAQAPHRGTGGLLRFRRVLGRLLQRQELPRPGRRPVRGPGHRRPRRTRKPKGLRGPRRPGARDHRARLVRDLRPGTPPEGGQGRLRRPGCRQLRPLRAQQEFCCFLRGRREAHRVAEHDHPQRGRNESKRSDVRARRHRARPYGAGAARRTRDLERGPWSHEHGRALPDDTREARTRPQHRELLRRPLRQEHRHDIPLLLRRRKRPGPVRLVPRRQDDDRLRPSKQHVTALDPTGGAGVGGRGHRRDHRHTFPGLVGGAVAREGRGDRRGRGAELHEPSRLRPGRPRHARVRLGTDRSCHRAKALRGGAQAERSQIPGDRGRDARPHIPDRSRLHLPELRGAEPGRSGGPASSVPWQEDL